MEVFKEPPWKNHPFLVIVKVDSKGEQPEAFVKVFKSVHFKIKKRHTGALPNKEHQQWYVLHTNKTVNQWFIDLKALVHEHRTHKFNFILNTYHGIKKQFFYRMAFGALNY